MRCARPRPSRTPRRADADARATSAKGQSLAAPHRVGEHRRAKQLEPFLERKAGPCDELWCRLRGNASSQPGRASGKIRLSSSAPAATNITPIKGSPPGPPPPHPPACCPDAAAEAGKGPQHQYAAEHAVAERDRG